MIMCLTSAKNRGRSCFSVVFMHLFNTALIFFSSVIGGIMDTECMLIQQKATVSVSLLEQKTASFVQGKTDAKSYYGMYA